MSKASSAESRAEKWFSEYLRLGSDRSLRKLAAETEQTCSIHGWDRPPSERTLFDWSARFGWNRRAKAHDAEVMERARAQLVKKRADLAERRMELALDQTLAFHALVRSGLTIETPVLDEHGNGRTEVLDDGSNRPMVTRRAAAFRELRKPDIAAIIALHNAAVGTEQRLLAGAPDQYREMQNRQGEDGPGVTVLGPEAIHEMGIKIGSLVRHLSDTTERRKAERADATVVQTSSEQPVSNDDDPDDPGLEWEEVDEDE